MIRLIEIAERIWTLAVCNYVRVTGKGKRSRQWKAYVRSEAAKKAWVTRKQNIANRKYAEFLDRVHVTPEELAALATPPFTGDDDELDCATEIKDWTPNAA